MSGERMTMTNAMEQESVRKSRQRPGIENMAAPSAAFGRSGAGRGLVGTLGEMPSAAPLGGTKEKAGSERLPASRMMKAWGAAVLASVSLAVAGCGDTNEYNYYIIPQNQSEDAGADSESDAEASPDGDLADSGPDAADSDAADADEAADAEADAEADIEACIPSLAPESCDSSAPLAEDVLSLSSSIWVGSIEFALEGVEMHASGVRAIIDIKDNCGTILKKESVLEGEIKQITIEGATYELHVQSLHWSETDPWAFVSIGIECYDGEACVTERGVIHPGEVLLESSGARGIRLDDLMTADGLAAILSLVDTAFPEPVTLGNYVLSEGEDAMVDEVVGVRVNTIAAGYSYTARWADVSFFTADCE